MNTEVGRFLRSSKIQKSSLAYPNLTHWEDPSAKSHSFMHHDIPAAPLSKCGTGHFASANSGLLPLMFSHIYYVPLSSPSSVHSGIPFLRFFANIVSPTFESSLREEALVPNQSSNSIQSQIRLLPSSACDVAAPAAPCTCLSSALAAVI